MTFIPIKVVYNVNLLAIIILRLYISNNSILMRSDFSTFFPILSYYEYKQNSSC